MGDRCYITVRIPDQPDQFKIVQALIERLGTIETGDIEEGSNYLRLSWSEVNYGAGSYFTDDFPKAFPSATLEVTNDQGSSYGPGVILLTGEPENPFIEIAILFEGWSPAVEIKPDGTPCPEQLKEAREFLEHQRRIFGGK